MLKQAGITFFLEGSQKISKPKNILNLSNDLITWLYDKGYQYTYDEITSDGGDFDKMTGTINWYINPKTANYKTQEKLAHEWIKEQELMDYEIQLRGPEISGLSTVDRKIMVYRLDVIKNGSADYMSMPEMHLSNVNAHNLLAALNISSESFGTISLRDLRQRLALLTETKMRDFTRDPMEYTEDDMGLGLRGYDPGTPIGQIQGYVDELNRIVDFGLANGFKNLVWS